jgi:hypothetical protein
LVTSLLFSLIKTLVNNRLEIRFKPSHSSVRRTVLIGN